MVNKISQYLVYLCLMAFSFSAGAVDEVIHCLALQEEGCSVAVSRFEEKLDYQIGNQPVLIPEELSLLLTKYYQYAKGNNLNKILELYSSSDGSWSQMQERIRKNPTMYARFHAVGRINVYRIVQMAEYWMVGVRWYDIKDQLLGNWTELVQCQKQCKMSALLLAENSGINFFNIAVLGNSPLSALPNGELVTYLESGKFPAGFSFKAKL